MTTVTKIRAIATTSMLALALAACGNAAEDQESVTTPSPTPIETADAGGSDDAGNGETDADTAAAVDVPAPLQFETTTVVDGTAFEGASLAGQNVILWFWAPWCPSCQAESGAVAEAVAELPDGVTLIGVSGRAERPDMQAFVDDYGVENFVHLADEDGSIWAGFGITTQPSYAIINDDGTVQVMFGAMGRSGILMQAEELLAS